MQIRCRTLFDITATGITGHYRPERVPFQDDRGNLVKNVQDWNRGRNQQRNWETLTQLISLRTQVSIMKKPQQDGESWHFDFDIDQDVFGTDLSVLETDCEGVPMLLNLGEKAGIDSVLHVDQNIWFNPISVNN